MSHLLRLVHLTTREKKTCVILEALPAWKLRMAWGNLAGVYYYSLKANRLRPSEHSKRDLLWTAEDPLEAENTWRTIRSGGLFVPSSTPDPMRERVAKTEAAILELNRQETYKFGA